MTKGQLMAYMEPLEDDDEVSLNELLRDMEEARENLIEELEERQHASGMYAFQDMMDQMRFER